MKALILIILPLLAFGEDIFPQIEVTFGDKRKLPCKLDPAVNVYVCADGKHSVLVRHSPMGYLSLGKDPETGTVKSISITAIESGSKVLFEQKYFGDFSSNLTSIQRHIDFFRQYGETVTAVDNFLFNFMGGPSEALEKGSPEYEELVSEFLQEKDKLLKKAEEIATAQSYQIELEDGTKVSCSRGGTKPLRPEEIERDTKFRSHTQCGIFKCDPVTIKGKTYQGSLVYDSDVGALFSGAFLLTDKENVLGPDIHIRKITSPLATVPLVDNSPFIDIPATPLSDGPPMNLLPESLKQNERAYTLFKDPGFQQYLDFYKEYCTDEDKTLKSILEAQNKLRTNLAEMDLVQFIQLMGDDSLMSLFMDPHQAQSLGCYQDGLYLDKSVEQNQNLLERFILNRPIENTISSQKAEELFKQASAMEDIAWGYKQDGCYARAHLMARRFEAQGVRVDKVWIKGDLYIPDSEPLIQWNFHVAPVVYVKNEQGSIQKMVIDPSLFDHPVSVEEWDKKISKKTVKGSTITAFPFPENAAFFERSAIAFSSSDHYFPHDSASLTEKEKMELAEKTMKFYKPLEVK